MTPRTRTVAIVAALALLAAVVVAGSAALSSDDQGASVAPAVPTGRKGAPPLVLDFGVREDASARALRQATRLYASGDRAGARELFLRDDSLEAKLGLAFASWPGSLDRVEQLGALYPRSALLQLHVGLARFWAGETGSLDAWREARDVEPDTPYAVSAGDLLHRDFAPGLPLFQPTAALPAAVVGKRPARQLELLRLGARRGRLADQLLYGVALQRLGRPLSARRAFEAAARAHPDEPEALVADAVGRYSKESPVEAFSRLGPLSRRFPEAATVRFHLGLLLLWQGDVTAARKQLRQARMQEPGSRIATEAGRYLDELAKVGTS